MPRILSRFPQGGASPATQQAPPQLAEAQTDGGVRYIVRRNPLRADEPRASLESKLPRVRQEAQRQTECLGKHPRARVAVALRKLRTKAAPLKRERRVLLV